MSKMMLGYIVAAVLAIAVIVVVIIIINQIRNRVKDVHKALPSLDKVDSLNNPNKDADKVTVGNNSDQLNEAMSVSADDEFDRKDYIKTDKTTSLEEDFGDALYSPKERLAKEIAKNAKPVTLPTLPDNKKSSLPGLNNLSKINDDERKSATDDKKEKTVNDDEKSANNDDNEQQNEPGGTND